MDSDKLITATFIENAPPVALNDAFTMEEDDTLSVGEPGLLSNDSDPDGDALSVTLLSGASKGSVTLNSNGAFIFVPQQDSSGTDSFIYSASDGKGGTTEASVILTVNSVQDTPIAQNDAFGVQEGDTLTVLVPGVLANDWDPDGDPLSTGLNNGPSNGSLSFNGDGSFVYLPTPGFHGTDSFTYIINDGNGASSSATVSLTVTEINDLPVVADDAFTLSEDSPLTVAAPGVLANDLDSDGDALSALVTGGPTHGTLTLNSDGSFSFTPNLNFNGIDSFTYSASDGRGGSTDGTVTLTVSSIPDPPVAGDDAFTTSADSPLIVPAPGILANDSDADGDNLQAAPTDGPANGSLNLNADGSFTYAPNSGFAGIDNFTYEVSDGNGGSAPGAVTIVVSPAQVTLEQTNSGSSSEVSQVSTSGPVRGVSGHLYLASLSTKPYRAVTNVVGLGLIWTRLDAQCAGRNNTGVEVWMAQGMPSGDDIVTAQFSSVPKNAVIVTSRYSGVASSQAIGTILSGNSVGLEGPCSGGSDSGSYAFDLVSAGGSVIYGAIAMRNKTHTPGNGYEERIEILQGTGGSGASLAIVDQTVELAGGVRLQGTFSSDVDWAVIGFEIKAGSGGSQDPQAILTIATSGNGSVNLSPEGGLYPLGTEVLLTANPNAGWNFAGWSGDATGTASPITLTMDSNKSVTANFVESPPAQHSLSTSVSGNGSISVLPSGPEYPTGTTVSVTATAATGWVFTGWSGDLVGAVNPIMLVMDSPKSVTAEFIENAVPVAVDDTFALDEDDTLSVATPGLLANDHDPDGDPLIVSLADDPSSGTVTVNPDGSLVYIPAPNYNGADLFTYSISDGKSGAAQGSVVITVNPLNDLPLALEDNYNVNADLTLNVPAPGILENDTDADGDALGVSLLTGPTNGSLSLSANGSFTYTPNIGFSGSDGFGYLVSDGHGGVGTGTVTLAVNPATVTYEESVTGSSFNASAVSTSANLTGVRGNLYLAAVSTKPFREVTNMTGLGLTWIRVDEQCSGRNKTGLEIWRAQGVPSEDGVVIANLASAPKTAVIAVARYSGADASSPLSNVISGNSNGQQGACAGGPETNSYSFGFETSIDGSVVFAAITMRERFHTPGVGYSERNELVEKTGGGGASIALMDKRMDSAGTTTLSGSFDRNVDWALIGVEIRLPSTLGKFTRTRGPVVETSGPPSRFQLFQNYPNPFNPSTAISYDIPSDSKVTLTIYDIKGRTVTTLVDEVKKAGRYKHVWKGKDSNDRPVASGVYFYRLKAGDYEQAFRMLLVR
ncbi:Ig-like domain-containing protein [bacterium]|nr:Ig-like domain-containing protein [bacterium]